MTYKNEFNFINDYINVEKNINLLNEDIQKGILPTSFVLDNLLKELTKLENQINKEENNVKKEIEKTSDLRNKKALELSLERLKIYKKEIPKLKKKLDYFLTLVTNKNNLDKDKINKIISIYDLDNDNKIDLDEIKELEKNITFLQTFKDDDLFKGFFKKNKIEFSNKEISRLITFFKKKKDLLQKILSLKDFYTTLSNKIGEFNKFLSLDFIKDFNNLGQQFNNLKVLLKESISNYSFNEDTNIKKQLNIIDKKLSLIEKLLNNIKKYNKLIKKFEKKNKQLLELSLKDKYEYYLKKYKRYKDLFTDLNINKYPELIKKLDEIEEDIKKISTIIKNKKEEERKKKKLIDDINYYKEKINKYSSLISISNEIKEILKLDEKTLSGFGLKKLEGIRDRLDKVSYEIGKEYNKKLDTIALAVAGVIGAVKEKSGNSGYLEKLGLAGLGAGLLLDALDLDNEDSKILNDSDNNSSWDNDYNEDISYSNLNLDLDSDIFNDFTSSGEDSW